MKDLYTDVNMNGAKVLNASNLLSLSNDGNLRLPNQAYGRGFLPEYTRIKKPAGSGDNYTIIAFDLPNKDCTFGMWLRLPGTIMAGHFQITLKTDGDYELKVLSLLDGFQNIVQSATITKRNNSWYLWLSILIWRLPSLGIPQDEIDVCLETNDAVNLRCLDGFWNSPHSDWSPQIVDGDDEISASEKHINFTASYPMLLWDDDDGDSSEYTFYNNQPRVITYQTRTLKDVGITEPGIYQVYMEVCNMYGQNSTAIREEAIQIECNGMNYDRIGGYSKVCPVSTYQCENSTILVVSRVNDVNSQIKFKKWVLFTGLDGGSDYSDIYCSVAVYRIG